MTNQSSPPLTRRLIEALGVMKTSSTHAVAKAVEALTTDDMLPLSAQVQIVSNFALRACYNQAGESIPEFVEDMGCFLGAKQYGCRAIEHIKKLGSSEPIEKELIITDDAGLKKIELSASRYVTAFGVALAQR